MIERSHIEWNSAEVEGPVDRLKGELARVWNRNAVINGGHVEVNSDSDN